MKHKKNNSINILIKNLFIIGFCALCFQNVSAQFTITDDFRNQGSPDVVIGDNAYFTSGIADPVGAGWLRLTEASGNQKGFAFVDRSFPSTLGVIADFEYIMWRNNSDGTYRGADGIGVFLFDGTINENNFALGGYGGSLGYAPNTASGTNEGLTGGYIGIGLDAYGNFGNDNEGRNGRFANPSSGRVPNAIALRGTTTNNPNTTNQFLNFLQKGSNRN